MQFKYAIMQLCCLVHFGSRGGCPILLPELKRKVRRPGFYFLNLIILREPAKFIGTRGGCDDEGAKTFPTKETEENEETKTFAENERMAKEFFNKEIRRAKTFSLKKRSDREK